MKTELFENDDITIKTFGLPARVFFADCKTQIHTMIVAFSNFCDVVLTGPKTYMLFTGWEVRTVKNCDLGLENAARDRGQHFQARGHSFSLYGPTLSRKISYLFFPLSQTTLKKLTQALL